MTSVFCIGEVMVELSLDTHSPTQAAVGTAGDIYNTAAYLKRSAPELTVAIGTKLGHDRFSSMILDAMKAEDIATDLITFSDDRLVGLYAISTDEFGERSFLYWRDQSAYRTLLQDNALDLRELNQFDYIYFSAISIAVLPAQDRIDFLNWLPSYRQAGGQVIFDSNFRPRLWPDTPTAQVVVARAWKNCDIGLPSVDDEKALFGDPDEASVVRRLAGWGVNSGALKCGADGPVPLGPDARPTFTRVTSVIDTTAAGDSFNAAYLAARLTGFAEPHALAAGHKLASTVIQHKGAIMPRNSRG